MSPKFAFVVPALLTLALSFPADATAQRQRGDAPSEGAVSRPAPPAPAPSGGGSSGSGATASTPSSGGDSGSTGGRAVDRGGSRSGGSARTRGSSGGDNDRATSGRSGRDGSSVPPYSRPREGRTATGEAVERRAGSGGGSTVIITDPRYYGGFYPWGWGGLGFGSYYGGGYYDPYGYDPYGFDPYGYDPYQSNYSGRYDGALRLKVKPRDASVFVDGYYAGRVDEFDGLFQRLHIDSGPHRIEIRQDGYEPLTFEVRIQPDRTVTYEGELQRVP
jgi:PEGA domain